MAHVDFGAECSAASGQVRFSAFSEPVKFHLGGGGQGTWDTFVIRAMMTVS